MAYFYDDTSDTDLNNELLAGCAELYIQKREFSGNGVLNTVGGGNDELQLVGTSGASNDAYNSTQGLNLYIIDDNSKLAAGKVVDTIGGTGETVVVFDSSTMVLVEDGTTAPTFTDATTYKCKVLSGSNKNEFGDYFGYTDDSLEFDNTPETEPLEICNIDGQLEEKDEVVTKANVLLTGATFNVPNKDIVSKVMNATQYGLNTATQDEFHGGFSPDISARYEITAKTKDRAGSTLAIQLFEVQLLLNGALALSGAGWKSISFQAKGKSDNLRDSNVVNAYRILRRSA
jgi:hypothetical protein